MFLFDPTRPKSSLLSNNTTPGTAKSVNNCRFSSQPSCFSWAAIPFYCLCRGIRKSTVAFRVHGCDTHSRLAWAESHLLITAEDISKRLQGTTLWGGVFFRPLKFSLGTKIHVPESQQAQRGITQLILRVTARETNWPSSWDCSYITSFIVFHLEC